MSLEDVSGQWPEWRLQSADAWHVMLVADNDLSYHHSVEVHFTDVRYAAIAGDFHWAAFRQPTDDELEYIRALGVLDADDTHQVYVWDAETANGHGRFMVVAESVSVNVGLVSHS